MICKKCGLSKEEKDSGCNNTCSGGHEWWDNYFDGRLKYEHPAGFVIIVPKDAEYPTPLWCDICNLIMKTIDDTIYYKKYHCCFKCGLKWADPRQKEWAAGWRPLKEDIVAEVELRKSLPVSIDYKIFDETS